MPILVKGTGMKIDFYMNYYILYTETGSLIEWEKFICLGTKLYTLYKNYIVERY